MLRTLMMTCVVCVGMTSAACSETAEQTAPCAGMEERMKASDLTPESNTRFLEAYGQEPGVETTATGLRYCALSEGTGAKPGPTSRVTVHYTGRLINGVEFDSSVGGEPITFPLNRVIPGWTEGLQLMREGGKAELVIPSELGYGSRGAGRVIPPDQTLVFQVELLKVE